ncbi:Pseudouridine synthase I, TruA [Sesbania bispinosa]|nr:Pseudouridine synthase I, TruA [Sesbania bispinosa]
MATQLNDIDYIASLQARVKELEAENAKLLSQLADCQSHEMEKKLLGPDEKVKESIKGNRKSKEKIEKLQGYNTRLMSHHNKRYVALKVMYFGKRFYGFASEAQMEPTVESEIFKALEKTRLLVGDKKESQYSRCGRTDKGVSSVGQVIALFLRSNLKMAEANNGSYGETVLEEQQEGEIDYVRVLNRVLPNDIRILGWCPVPVDFHARFSCLSREYKYFFWKENLNIPAMESAGMKLVGEHDFRNFCKMDAANVHNYRRHITTFEISPTDVRYDGNQLWVIKIRGSAFLWHQVRCMVAVLFLVGKGLESPNVVDMLLDTNWTPRKPQYIMASEVPLVLQSCEFEDIKFMCSSDAGESLRVHLVNECQTYQLQAAIFHEALLSCVPLLQGAANTSKLAANSRIQEDSLSCPSYVTTN